MGEVYRARDPKLRRDVAIKVLPAAFTADPERLARFEREARVLASLNHPHIAHIYGFEQDGEVRALVLELVEGQTLEDRLQSVSSSSTRTSALPTAEALGIARQIADALDAAHEKGIVHRDLKPANVKITPEGVVKVLDFGLAKTRGNLPAAEMADAATMSAPATNDGVLLGTVPYMSPEQARGQAVDRRTDIWALGCVLYEMLAGKRAFRGATTTDVLAAILEREPDWSAVPATTPRSIERLLRRCLDKDPKRRIRDIGDVHREIEEILAEPALPVATTPVAARRRRWAWVAAAAALAVLAAAAGLTFGRRSTPVVPAAPVSLSIPFVERPHSLPFGIRHLAISEDGSRVAYAAASRLWIRPMDQPDPIAIELIGSNPFFSPDGEWLGVFSSNALVKVPTDGGPPTTIAETTARPAGAAWRADGTIVFATGEGLFQVPAGGGEPRLLARPDRSRGERLYAWPHFLPDGHSVLLTILYEDSAVAPRVVSLDSRTLEPKLILEGGSDARYLPTGHLVYASGTTLEAVAFDPDTGTVQGDPVSLPGIVVATAADNGAANFSVSASGTLTYTSRVDFRSFMSTLQWIDRSGVEERLPIKPGFYSYPRVSPDGKRVALGDTGRHRDIWVLDLERLSLTQLTDGPTENMVPEWSRDGSRIFFASDRSGNFDVYSQAADGATEARVELAAPGLQNPMSLTPDGKQLVVFENFKDVGLVTLGQPDRVEPLLHSKAEERTPRVSPDGRWIAYESNESGTQIEIFVRPFPDTSGGREKISVDGGRYPVWGRGGRELYYVTLDGDMMAAAISLSPSLKLGPVTKLFRWLQPPPQITGIPYDVSPLDRRFLALRPVDAEQSGPTQISVVLNWFSELSRQVGTR